MTDNNHFDAIIIGGSYSGLSAAMSLGRSLRNVLVIDSGTPCNRQTPSSHNFITQDGQTPAQIALDAKDQVSRYETIRFYNGLVTAALKTEEEFKVETTDGDVFTAKKLLFATGLEDTMPPIEGFAECWGISILHCPYCHGYEIRNEKTGLIGNGETGFEFAKLISHWTRELTLFTNGKSTLTPEQTDLLEQHGIAILETEIENIQHTNGRITQVFFKDGSASDVKAIYARIPFEQQCDIPIELGCELTDHGLLQVDQFQKTSVPGVFACGDNSNLARAVSIAVSSGTMAGASLNKELIEEGFQLVAE